MATLWENDALSLYSKLPSGPRLGRVSQWDAPFTKMVSMLWFGGTLDSGLGYFASLEGSKNTHTHRESTTFCHKSFLRINTFDIKQFKSKQITSAVRHVEGDAGSSSSSSSSPHGKSLHLAKQ